MKICKVENCNNKQHAKGLCERHYTQVRKHGHILSRTRFDRNEFTDRGHYYKIVLYNNNNQKITCAKVDKEYYNIVKDYRWRLNSNGYVKTLSNTLGLHNLIIGNNKKIYNNFINGNKADCRCENLRFFKGEKIKIDLNNNIFNLLLEKKKRVCKVKNCNNKHHAKGLCAKHYAQFKKHGHILDRTRFDANGIATYAYYYGIALYNNKGDIIAEVKIDKRDYNIMKDYKWRLNFYGHVITGHKKSWYLHNLFINKRKNATMQFINGDKLDNRRCNLKQNIIIQEAEKKEKEKDLLFPCG